LFYIIDGNLKRIGGNCRGLTGINRNWWGFKGIDEVGDWWGL